MNKQISVWWIFLQGLAIVGSILLAFAIEAWWDQREEDELEREYLESYELELKRNLQRVREASEFNEAVLSATYELFDLATKPIHERDLTRVEGLIADVRWFWSVPLASGARDAIISSGNLSVIDDAEVRLGVASVQVLYDVLNDRQSAQHSVKMLHLDPYLAKNAYLPKFHTVGMERGMPTVSRQNVIQPSYPLVEPQRNHAELLDDQEFLGLLLINMIEHQNALGSYEIAIPWLESAIAGLGSQLSDP